MFVRIATTSQQQRRASTYSIYREELDVVVNRPTDKRRSSLPKPPSRRHSTFNFIGLLKEVDEDEDVAENKPSSPILEVESDAYETEDSGLPPRIEIQKRLLPLPPRICLLVGGKLFQTFEATLSTYPETLLGDRTSREKYLDKENNTYKFDRCSISFDSILFYYQSRGILSKPINVKRADFIEELEFFQINAFLDPRHKLETAFLDQLKLDEDMPRARKEKIIRRLLGLKRNSWMERICYVFYLIIIGISIFNICLETLKELKGMNIFLYMDFAFCILLTLEYCLHLVVAKHVITYVFSFSGLMDLCAVLPTLCFTIFSVAGYLNIFNVPYWLTRFVDFLRISRVIKCFQASRGLRQVLLVLFECREYILLLVVSILQACLIFSSLVYEVEDMQTQQKSMFPQYLESFWYAIITATGVGYGDFYPRSVIGKFFGSSLAILGVLLFCLPTSKLVYKFVECFYLPYILTEECWGEKRRKLMTVRRNTFLEEMFF